MSLSRGSCMSSYHAINTNPSTSTYSSHKTVNLEVARKAAYERTNSVIFAPFMINVVCQLLNQHYIKHNLQQPLNITNHIHQWGGGLKILKQCYPEWDKRVKEACSITHTKHKIWKDFVNYHDIPGRERFDPIHTLQHLLQQWINIGRKNNNYGPYPSDLEQEKFGEVCLKPMQFLTEAIVNFKFEKSFEANRLSIKEFLEQQLKEKESKQSLVTLFYLITSHCVQSLKAKKKFILSLHSMYTINSGRR